MHAASLDDEFPSAVVGAGDAGIEDDSAFYGADTLGKPDFVARDDAAFLKSNRSEP